LDNNFCERALKRAVLHRKNALFYKTMTSAHTGDLFMSLIHSSELCGATSFRYLPECKNTPANWLLNPASGCRGRIVTR